MSSKFELQTLIKNIFSFILKFFFKIRIEKKHNMRNLVSYFETLLKYIFINVKYK